MRFEISDQMDVAIVNEAVTLHLHRSPESTFYVLLTDSEVDALVWAAIRIHDEPVQLTYSSAGLEFTMTSLALLIEYRCSRVVGGSTHSPSHRSHLVMLPGTAATGLIAALLELSRYADPSAMPAARAAAA
jgi:hypothetical protein